MRVMFQGLEFRTDAEPSGAGARLVISPDGWDGWDSMPNIRRESTARPSSHGSFAEKAYWQDRLVTIDGHAIAETPGDLTQLELRFKGLGLGYERFEVFTDDGKSRWALGAVNSGEFKPFDDIGYATEASFQLQVWFPEPWQYGDAHKHVLTAAGVPIANRGNANAWPVIRIQGPLTAPYSMQIKGRRVNVLKSLTSSQWIEIDTKTGAATTNSVESGRLYSEVNGLMPFIPPGPDTLVNTSTATITYSFSDTYV